MFLIFGRSPRKVIAYIPHAYNIYQKLDGKCGKRSVLNFSFRIKNHKNLKTKYFEKIKNGLEIWWSLIIPTNFGLDHVEVSKKWTDGRTIDPHVMMIALLTESSKLKIRKCIFLS